MQTESRNPRSADLDRLSTLDVLKLMNDEDATVAGAVRAALPQIARLVDETAKRLRDGGRLFYVGAGTSGRLGVLDAAECVPTFGTPPTLVQAVIAGGETALVNAVEGAEDNRDAAVQALQKEKASAGDVVVGIAASGRTPFVLAAVEHANEVGAVTGGIACNADAPLLDSAQVPISVPVGAEVLTGSTRLKAGTAQKLVLNMISTATMVRLGKVYSNLMVDVKVTNAKLAERAQRIVQEVTGVDDARARELLAQSGNRVKVAIAMELLGIDADTAETRLGAVGGHLRAALEQHNT